MRGNLAESLYSLGRWDEAGEAAATRPRRPERQAPRLARRRPRRTSPWPAATWPRPAANSPPPAATSAPTTPQPQHALPLPASRSASPPARAASSTPAPSSNEALDTGFPPGTQRYAWPLLLAAATAEADARGLPAAEPGRAEVLDRLREAAKSLPRPCPSGRPTAWVRAELLRAEGRDTPDLWAEARRRLRAPGAPLRARPGPAPLAEALLRRRRRERSERDRARNSCAWPTPPPTTSAPARSPTPSPCSPSAPASRLARAPERSAPAPADPVRGARPDPPRTGRAAPGRRRPQQPPDRRGALHLPEDGQRPRLQHPRQARRLRPRRGGRAGPPAAAVPAETADARTPGGSPAGRISGSARGLRCKETRAGEAPCSTWSRSSSRQAASTPMTEQQAAGADPRGPGRRRPRTRPDRPHLRARSSSVDAGRARGDRVPRPERLTPGCGRTPRRKLTGRPRRRLRDLQLQDPVVAPASGAAPRRPSRW